MGDLLDRIKAKTKQIEGLLTGNKVRHAEGLREERVADAKRAARRIRNAFRRQSTPAGIEER